MAMGKLFWRALFVQAALIAAASGALIALPLSDGFFKHGGFVIGPVAWVLAALVTARLLSLPRGFVLFSALAGGVAGTIVSLVASHWPGVVAALLVFAASCAGYEPEPSEGVTASAAGK
jgi:hypothetical protein